MSNNGDSIAVGMRASEGVIFDSASSPGSATVSSIETSHASPRGEITPAVAQFNQIDPTITRQFVCAYTFAWKSTQTAGTLLWSAPIMPAAANMWLKYLSGMYNTWRGGFDYKIKVAGTGFHSGAVLLVRLPPNYEPSKITSTAAASAFPYVVIDPKCLEAISHGAMDQANIMYHWMSSDVKTTDISAIGGFIAVYVMLPLGNNSDSATSINLQIFVKPSFDFVFGQLIPPPGTTYSSDRFPQQDNNSNVPVSGVKSIIVDPGLLDSRAYTFGMCNLRGEAQDNFSVFKDYPEYNNTGFKLANFRFVDGRLYSYFNLAVKGNFNRLPIGISYPNSRQYNLDLSNFDVDPGISRSFASGVDLTSDVKDFAPPNKATYFTPLVLKQIKNLTTITNVKTASNTISKLPLFVGETFVVYVNNFLTFDGYSCGTIYSLQSRMDQREYKNFPTSIDTSYKVAVIIAKSSYGLQPHPDAFVYPDGSWIWTFFRLSYQGALLALNIQAGKVLQSGQTVFKIVDIIRGREVYCTDYQNECEFNLPLACIPYTRWTSKEDIDEFIKYHNALFLSEHISVLQKIFEFEYRLPYGYLMLFFLYFDLPDFVSKQCLNQLIQYFEDKYPISLDLYIILYKKYPSQVSRFVPLVINPDWSPAFPKDTEIANPSSLIEKSKDDLIRDTELTISRIASRLSIVN